MSFKLFDFLGQFMIGGILKKHEPNLSKLDQ